VNHLVEKAGGRCPLVETLDCTVVIRVESSEFRAWGLGFAEMSWVQCLRRGQVTRPQLTDIQGLVRKC
jgi:hypothetical protein